MLLKVKNLYIFVDCVRLGMDFSFCINFVKLANLRIFAKQTVTSTFFTHFQNQRIIMFRKAAKEAPTDWVQEQNDIKAVCQIAQGTVIEGVVKVQEANMRLDGEIVGNVFCAGRMLLSPTAVIRGNVECFDLISEGKIEGNVSAKNGIALLKTACLTGDIQCRFVQIENGAFFNGKSTMVDRAE